MVFSILALVSSLNPYQPFSFTVRLNIGISGYFFLAIFKVSKKRQKAICVKNSPQIYIYSRLENSK
jgi:hypothetical protein